MENDSNAANFSSPTGLVIGKPSSAAGSSTPLADAEKRLRSASRNTWHGLSPLMSPNVESIGKVGGGEWMDELSPIAMAHSSRPPLVDKRVEPEEAESIESLSMELQENQPVEQQDVNESKQDLNESVCSTGSWREEEIEKMKEELGATSLAFIQRLRGAAFRRKANLARSRDSLAAKERQQREAIAAAKAAKEKRRQSEPLPRPSAQPKVKLVNAIFHARPLPATTGSKGAGGLSGVPKVDKKPTTVPVSPMLGRRRKSRLVDGDEHVDEAQEHERESDTAAFRALPLPKTSGPAGHAGLAGVPKVPKRPTTVPRSPMLGMRRPKPAPPAVTEETRESTDGSRRRSTLSADDASSQPSEADLGLAGLTLVDRASAQGAPLQTPRAQSIGYEPFSTTRAKQRAAYDVKNQELQREGLKQESAARKAQIRKLEKELRVLRKSIG